MPQAIPAVIGVGGSILGSKLSSNAQADAANAAAQQQQQALDQALQLGQPFREAGQTALGQILGLQLPGQVFPGSPGITGQLFGLPGGGPSPGQTSAGFGGGGFGGGGFQPGFQQGQPLIQQPPQQQSIPTETSEEAAADIRSGAQGDLDQLTSRLIAQEGSTIGTDFNRVREFLSTGSGVGIGRGKILLEQAIGRAGIDTNQLQDLRQRISSPEQFASPPVQPGVAEPGRLVGPGGQLLNEAGRPIGREGGGVFPSGLGGQQGQFQGQQPQITPGIPGAPPNITPGLQQGQGQLGPQLNQLFNQVLPPGVAESIQGGQAQAQQITPSALANLQLQLAQEAIQRRGSAQGLLGAGATLEAERKAAQQIGAQEAQNLFQRNLAVGQLGLGEAQLGLQTNQFTNQLLQQPFQQRLQALQFLTNIGAQQTGLGAQGALQTGQGLAGSALAGGQARAGFFQDLAGGAAQLPFLFQQNQQRQQGTGLPTGAGTTPPFNPNQNFLNPFSSRQF